MEQTVAWMRMAALVRRRAHSKERKLMTVWWIVSVGGVRPCSADSSCGNCCNFVEFPRKLLTGQTVLVDAGVSVDIISGVNDPPPISCLFPRSAPYNTFRSCRNLHSIDVDNIRFLGTYGKKINDLHKYSKAKSKLDFVERTLRWRHLAPTAPNTLNRYPFTDGDSFVIETCPHVINITTVCELKFEKIPSSEFNSSFVSQFIKYGCFLAEELKESGVSHA
ncbi:hypothetical protein F2Q69_00041663 [Brassica cretica]|uniref:DNA polymerase alpha/delta/epsilon subunit B domain-containing protein n=1 Tax=Brassica cretica TaxID=69181 RepID=A0A8S9NME6_BRACR|nr:hypothetical protein F2Q69_00041663 [Brassica cretica]